MLVSGPQLDAQMSPLTVRTDSPSQLSHTQHQISRLRDIRDEPAHNPCLRPIHSPTSVLDLALRAYQPEIHSWAHRPAMDASTPHSSRRHSRKHISLVSIRHSNSYRWLSIRARHTCCHHKPKCWYRPHPHCGIGAI